MLELAILQHEKNFKKHIAFQIYLIYNRIVDKKV
jgi:hypothetical protein